MRNNTRMTVSLQYFVGGSTSTAGKERDTNINQVERNKLSLFTYNCLPRKLNRDYRETY